MNYTYIITLFSGGVVWEVVKFFYPDIKNYLEKRKKAKEILHKNLDLAIKSADELYGKLESLSKEDFATFINIQNSNSNSPEHNQIYTCYLFAQFWASLEIIRLQSNYSSITRLKKGKELIRFIETIESRKFRILDRSKQRIIGESMIINADDKFKIVSLYTFFYKIENDTVFNKWINELKNTILSSKKKEIRQQILTHGLISAMFIDHFDSKEEISRRRKIYKNKLSRKSKVIIKNVLLTHYLKFIENKENYY
ncbi:hypothetical protein Q4595_16275 [Wenyingzhuangia sp. 1_MG-2023]|nr:hypothetical protein [Wenyingzhuangia sp. 1_MG-2023]